MKNLNVLDLIAVIVLIVGGINWGLVGLLQFDLVVALFGKASLFSRSIYILVGISSIYVVYLTLKIIKEGN